MKTSINRVALCAILALAATGGAVGSASAQNRIHIGNRRRLWNPFRCGIGEAPEPKAWRAELRAD